MKTPQLLYLEIKKSTERLAMLQGDSSIIEAQLRASAEALAPPEPKKSGMLAKMNPLADMPDLGAIDELFNLLPVFLEKRQEMKDEQLNLNCLHLQLAHLLVEQHLQGA